jgi:hypothetical protein
MNLIEDVIFIVIKMFNNYVVVYQVSNDNL